MRNWAGNYAYNAARFHEPTSVEQLQDLVRSSRRVRALGTRHSFSAIADSTGDLVSLTRLPPVLEIDTQAGTVGVDGAVRYGDICRHIHEAGLGLHNMASLPHISVAGATATATHGSGERSGSLSSAVRSMEIVRADGELLRVERTGEHKRWWPAVAASLGALGVITRLTLDAEVAYLVRQDVFDDLPTDSFADHFDDIVALAYSVSFFTDWSGQLLNQVWLKQRMAAAEFDYSLLRNIGARRAAEPRHPIAGRSPAACTTQMGIAGPWHERLPHFRLEHTPSSGDELQSEYFVRREDCVKAFHALQPLRRRIAEIVQVSEIRTVAADEVWLSPAYARDSVAFHFTWQPDWPSVRALLPQIEAALQPFEPRPHWAKLFTLPPAELMARYPQRSSFVAVAAQLDATGKFRNGFLDRYLFGERS